MKTDSLTVLPAPSTDFSGEALAIVRPGSPLAHALDVQGVEVNAPGAQRAVAKAITGLAKDIMEGAALLAADTGHEGAKRAVACLSRVRAERAIRK